MADGLGFGDIQIPALEDLVGGLFGADRFSQLFSQDESDFKQFSDTVTDRRIWSGVKDKSSPEYFFLLKYDTKTLQIPFNINPQREIITHPHAMTVTNAQGGGKVVNSDGMNTKDITIQGACGLYPGNRKPTAPTSGIGSGLEQIKFLETLFQRYCFLKRFGDAAKTLQLVYVNRRLQDAWVVEPKSFTRDDAIEHNFNFNYTIVLETIYPYNGADAKSLAEQLIGLVPGFSTFDSICQKAAEAVDNLNAVIGEISAVVDGFVNIVMSDFTALAQAYADIKTGKLPNKTSFKKDATKSLIKNLQASANALESANASPKLVAAIIKAEQVCKGSLLQDKLYTPSPKSTANTVADKQKSQALNLTNADGSSVSPQEAKAVGAATTKPSQQQLLQGSITTATATSITQGGGNPVLVGSTVQGSAALQKTSQNPTAIQALKKTNPTLAANLKASLDAQNKAKSTTTVGNAVQNQSSTSLSISSPTSDGPASTAPGEKPVALSGGLSKYSVTPPSFADKQAQAAWLSTINADLASIDPANADYKTALVTNGDDIQTLAYRLLGDHAKWPQLVMLNSLRYPYVASAAYIAANSLTNVIAWQSTITYAAPKAVGGQPTRIWRNETDISVGLSPFERALGNDIMISEASGNVVWGANDVELVYGVQNIKQFIRKRVTLKKGIWRRAAKVGFSDFLGQSDGVSGDVIRAEAQGLFIDDDRISSAEAVDVRQTAQDEIIVMRVVVRDVQQPIILPVNVA